MSSHPLYGKLVGEGGDIMWTYASPVGLTRIFPMPNGKFALEIAEIIYGAYQSPGAAADDVYMHVTGCYDWDVLDGMVPDVSTGLAEWNS